MKKKVTWKQVWHFIWEDDSVLSWIVNITLAFILIKFIVYPGLGFMLGTTHPVVAVVSESMEHEGSFDEWWDKGGQWYIDNNITKEDFRSFALKNGFNKGDIIVLGEVTRENTDIGDIIVFQTRKPDPIIHRIVHIWDIDTARFYQTKGDNYETNKFPIKNPLIDETQISEPQIIGKAVVRIPFLGYIKIWFVEFIITPYCAATGNTFPCR